jgi:pterin-4a-carbinolamine dehydratase
MSNQYFAFISYRRTDAPEVARGLHVQLRDRFGGNHIFMDVAGIDMGELWPERLQRELERSSVLLMVVGPGWLTAADIYGRRRLDQEGDWVCTELRRALDRQIPIIPLLLDDVATLPPPVALPAALRAVLNHQSFQLRNDYWDDDVNRLCLELISRHGFVDLEGSVLLPERRVKVTALSDAELDAALRDLPGWEPVQSMLARDYPNARLELRRAYRFQSFKKAMEFMQAACEPIQRATHHPRWENQWRTVVVYLSTWDIGHKITKLDIDLARELDLVASAFLKRR